MSQASRSEIPSQGKPPDWWNSSPTPLNTGLLPTLFQNRNIFQQNLQTAKHLKTSQFFWDKWAYKNGSSVSIPGTVPSVVTAEVSNQAMRHCLTLNADPQSKWYLFWKCWLTWWLHDRQPIICKILDASPTRLPSGVRSDEVVVVCSRLIPYLSMQLPEQTIWEA